MNKPLTKKRSLVFFLVPNFSMLPFSAAIDTLRIANRMLGYEAYTWRLSSTDGKRSIHRAASAWRSTPRLPTNAAISAAKTARSMVLVCSGIYVEDFNNKSVNAWLRETYNRGVAVGQPLYGRHVLASGRPAERASAAPSTGKTCRAFRSLPAGEVYADLYEVDSNLYTCAGGTASLDMMLNLIGEDFGETSSTASANRP
jgi:transcriptional regulator GlxA family with amidase domain